MSGVPSFHLKEEEKKEFASSFRNNTIKRMDFFFRPFRFEDTGRRDADVLHEKKYWPLMWTPYQGSMKGVDSRVSLYDIKKEKIKQLKLKEPVKTTYWVDDI
jgi:hypothetical protein